MKAEHKIYKTFLELKNNIYFSQIKEHTKLSNSSLQNTIKKLLENNILSQIKNKSNVFYRIKDNKTFELKFAELAIEKFNNLNVNIKIPLLNFIKDIPKDTYCVVLFGSSSRKEEKKNSDIDILVVSTEKINPKHKKNAELTSTKEISVFNCTINQFIENKDPVIIQARKTGFPIYKEQNFYEEIVNEYREVIQ
ncbi:nucleotidyltransferase domain-containing protein [Candidatus Woesearchaeota archaeon]|nr:nucleotidyltransferase domain-containing protein [Candidatus Woesearchaeota archaeon]